MEPTPIPLAPRPARATRRPGLPIRRHFTRLGKSPLDAIRWTRRTAVLLGAEGRPVFEQPDVEAPAAWSDLAVGIAASRYFHGRLGGPDRERSVRALLLRVARTIRAWGLAQGYFRSRTDADAFEAELLFLLVHQRLAFNSPVYFNLGVPGARPQTSACFIQSVPDSLEGILALASSEGRLFKHGSGSGTNLSSLRGEGEPLSGGGTASGPVAFMRGLDALAGAIKSGGRTRRAAKMVILDVDHPDIVSFIDAKVIEEAKARTLAGAGFEASVDEGLVAFQNANHSVRVTDAFMRAVEAGGLWQTRSRVTGAPVHTYPARWLWHRIAMAAWACGDPGVQFHDTVNRWHTCPSAGPIRASNPCSEYMFLDDSACNLASLNLLAFLDDAGQFDTSGFRAAVEVAILAMDILVGRSSYPTEAIEATARRYRPLGLGYTNLGALLMALGLPYDSEEGRSLAASLTALLTGAAYARSAEIAGALGPFEGYGEDREAMEGVLSRHAGHLEGIAPSVGARPVLEAARAAWGDVDRRAAVSGLRNAQATVLAPTGTISFLMDCDTTGIEPDMALVKTKRLVGGGVLRYVNRTLPRALERLGYGPGAVAAIRRHVRAEGTVEGAPGLRGEHLPVFDCALPQGRSGRVLSWEAHVAMMAALQPFVSGAISKTVNLGAHAAVEDVEAVHTAACRRGLKSIAVYRDASKATQPLTAGSLEGGSLDAGCEACGEGTVPAGTCRVCPGCGRSTACG